MSAFSLFGLTYWPSLAPRGRPGLEPPHINRYTKLVPFNHYAKLKRIIESQPNGWYIKRIDQPTQAKNFKGEVVLFTHYYRLYDHTNTPIPYGKFQQIDRLAAALNVPVESILVI